MTLIRDFDEFVRVHSFVLASSGIPSSLYRQLFDKLSAETFDGGDFFQIQVRENGRQRCLVSSSDILRKESHIFLVDHAWTFRLSDARKQLLEIPGLAERMAALMCVDCDTSSDLEDAEEQGSSTKLNASGVLERETAKAKEKGLDTVMWLELDELEIDDAALCSMDLSSKFPDLLALNLWGNKLENVEVVIKEITKFRKLKALWLNDNPIVGNCDGQVTDAILNCLPELEIYNSRFTRSYSEWALGFCVGIYNINNPYCSESIIHPLKDITTLDLSDRCIHSLSKKVFSPVEMPLLSHLNIRGNPLDSSSVDELLQLLHQFSSLKVLEVDIPGPLGKSAITILESIPNLSVINGIDTSKILESGKHVIDSVLKPRFPEWKPDEPLAERVFDAMWLYLMTYRLADEEKIDETSVWYVMDELGSALRHSDDPNIRVVPFLFMPESSLGTAVSFSVIWPIRDIHKGDECNRDFLFGIGEDKQRSARLTAWFHTPENYFIMEFDRYWQQSHLQSINLPSTVSSLTASILPNDDHTLHVFTDIPYVEEFLTRSEFTFTSNPKDADIIWTSMQVDEEVKNTLGLSDRQYINQFPFEACLVMKHHLAETVCKAQGSPPWFQPTYNLEMHLAELIGDYCVRKRNGLNNLWILKPWNMARTIDTTVTGDLSAIIRLMETGPKICQKYIENPALFQGKKFDLRYIVLVRSMNPLEIFLCDVFWARLANNNYSLEKASLSEYETHFTVMNYIGKLNHKNTPEFVSEFEKEHQVKWMDIHHRIRDMIKMVFLSASEVHPEMHSSKSRTIYGVDVMLDYTFQPKLLEVTYCPDCNRACKYDTIAVTGNGEEVKGKDFFNLVFGCLFLNESVHVSPL